MGKRVAKHRKQDGITKKDFHKLLDKASQPIKPKPDKGKS